MPIRLIAVDLDGTLLNSESELSLRNRQSLERARASGIEIVVATGRRSYAARRYIEQIPFPVTVISSNGAMTASAQGKVMFRHFLPRETAIEVLAATREFRPYSAVLFDIPGRGQILMQECAVSDGPLAWYLRNSPEMLQMEPDLERGFASNPIQVLFGGPPPIVESIEPLIRASSAEPKVHLSWTKYLRRNVSLLDVMTWGCSKGAALERWAQHRGILPAEIMAIGDNHNDLEMLRFAAYPVLMANHSAGLDCTVAEARQTLSNDEDGVAVAIEKYLAIDYSKTA